MLYSDYTGEQIILPVNPEKISIKYEKDIESLDILGFGQVNIMGNQKPLRVTLEHFLPEDNSIFGTYSGIMTDSDGLGNYIEYEYSSKRAVDILKRWAQTKIKARLVIDDELNIEVIVSSFSETIRESTSSKPYILDLIEYKNPAVYKKNSFGLIKRMKNLITPVSVLMKQGDTLYSIADKYGLDFKALKKKNDIQDVNKTYLGKKLRIKGE